ncbi:FYN-binding protein 1-like [Mantella aurantiaca]
MAHPGSFKSIQSKFQQELAEKPGTKPITRAPPGAKPVIPAKPNIHLASDRFFQKPVPKALSSPELVISPQSDPFKTTGNQIQSHQSFSFRSNTASHQEASLKRPSLPVIKPLLVPKPSVDISRYTNIANIHVNAVTTNRAKLEKSSPPKLKVLPSDAVLGLKPRKPARPPFVDLDKFTRSNIDNGDYVTMKSFSVPNPRQTRLTASQSQPNLTTCYPSRHIRNSLREKQEIYEDVTDFSSFKKSKSTSLQHVTSQSSEPDDLYDDAELILEKNKPLVQKPSCPVEQSVLITNWRNDTNVEKSQKQEQEFRKKFQFHGEIKVLTRMMVDPNAIVQKPGHKDLAYIRGEILDVIQLTDAKKILCRNCEGKFGYVPRKSVLNLEKNIYSNVSFGEVYDDTELISNTFPAVPAKSRFQSGYTTRLFERNSKQISKAEAPKKENLKLTKTEDKELKEMRKKFKFEGEIKVLTRMMVVPSAGNKRGGGKDLPISKGEIFEVIQFTNQEKILCRNSKGKYGYVKRRYVLQLEKELSDATSTAGSGIIQKTRR